jgi:UDP-glucuronate 4-epimerase
VAELVRRGERVVALDVVPGPGRLRLVLEPDELPRVEFAVADVADVRQLEQITDKYAITSVIHLAGLQVPFCRADPQQGAQVNVIGTINVLELAKRGVVSTPVVYASSVAALDAPSEQVAALGPTTLYGVFKRANEATAAVYWQEHGVTSIGLRPHTVYGPGRDQGITSAPTVAILSAAVGAEFRIPFGGSLTLQYTRDVAQAFIAASQQEYRGASVHSLPGTPVSMHEVIDTITSVLPESAGAITCDETPLPFPASLDSASFTALVGDLESTPLADGVRRSAEKFRQLISEGVIHPPIPS